MEQVPREVRDKFFRALKTKFRRCLSPYGPCKGTVIAAHSIPNARVLDRLQENGHVIVIEAPSDEGRKPRPRFTFKGRNEATTFEGLCGSHDKAIFQPIDDFDPQPSNAEQMFLLAYRAILRELHSKLGARALISRGAALVTNKESQEAFELFDSRAEDDIRSFQLVKNEYDRLFLSKSYAELQTFSVHFRHAKPVLAVSSVIGPHDGVPIGITSVSQRTCLAFSLMPIRKGLLATWSSLSAHARFAHSFLRNVKVAKGERQRYLVSKLVLANCENVVMAPRLIKSFSSSQSKVVLDFFGDTTPTGGPEFDSPHLLLF